MQLYGRGLRRRLPPMLDGDQRRIRMVYSLLFSLPGTPVLFYGEEIGMGENLDIEGRLAVRTPMQWTGEPDGGFSTADPSTFPARSPRARSVPSTSTSATRRATRTRCCRSSATSSTATARARSWRGAPSRWSTPGRRPRRCSRTAPTSTASPSSPSTTSARARSPRRLPLAELAGRELHDVLDGTRKAVRIAEDTTFDVSLPPYGFRWLRSTPTTA